MKKLSDWEIIGSGTERTCYLNPKNHDRCIKVSNQESSKQTKREIKYYNYLSKKNISYEHIPKFYGEFKNNGMIGLELEFIRNHDGTRAVSLGEYLNKKTNDNEFSYLLSALCKLKSYLIYNNIIPCDLVLSNLLVVKTKKNIKVVIIDGLGGTELIPISNYIPFFGKRKIERKWKILIEKVNKKAKKTNKI